MLLSVLDDTNTTSVPSSGDHDNIPHIKLDKVGYLVTFQVQLDGVISLDYMCFPDGKPTTLKERIEAIDESKKTITWSLFDGDLGKQYKVFILTLEVNERDDGSGHVKWIIEFEVVNENVEPPYSYLDFFNKSSKDINDYLVRA
ncbi:hypothetical protein RIF29_24490 [Crotalaria pallida]|uniref:Bet v I/Major latex protein domain-containing protein n=1 Tax=Crotalaria pallida TaxID=3830 RepID=A0AAN9EMC9_CROPI